MYDWMASGALPDYLRMHLWVRERKPSPRTITKKIDGDSRILQLPHADLIFDTGEKIFDDAINKKRITDGYRLVRIGPYYHEDTILKNHGPFFMASAHQLRTKHPRFAKDGGVRLILDSGGAQLKFGVTSYVDLEETMEAYNQHADVGMALDVPPRRLLSPRRNVDAHPLALRELARVQKMNNNYFAAHKREDLGLMNAAHGLTGDDFRRWITMVDNPAFSGWAISYDSDLDPYCIWRGAAVFYREFGGAGQWIHLFGVSGKLDIPLMAWAAQKLPHLTSDSSSWIQGVKSYDYLHNRRGRLDSISIGQGFAKMEVADGNPLEPYCTCEICQILKIFGAYHHTGMSRKNQVEGDEEIPNVTYPALAAHNLIAIKQSVASWNERASRMNYKQFQTEIRASFTNSREILHKLEYLECALVEGPEYADRHVARQMDEGTFLPLTA